MKKLLSLVLVIVMALGCTLALASCGGIEKDIVGTYEMESISGSISYGGTTTELEADLYEYYRIILDEDGKATVESKAATGGVKIREEGTWEYVDGKLEISTSPQGITVVEEMDWNDGTITYETSQSGQGMTIEFSIVLKKQ